MKNNTSHLIYVDSIPDNCIQITHYGIHQFENLYFCKTNNKLYQKIKYRIREIPLLDENGKRIMSYVKSTTKSIPISPLNLMKMIENGEYKNDN